MTIPKFINSVRLVCLTAFLTACCMTAVFADELPTRNVPYYSPDAAGSGNLEYRALRCMLDVYVPKNAAADAKLPVVVWFHGGGLSGGSKHEVSELTNHGIIVVSVNYRLRPVAKEPDYIEDAAAAVAWTFKNIEKYQGDPARIYVSGHSAGGYLTMMVGLDPRYMAAHGLKNTDIAGLFPISGQATTHFGIVADRKKAAGIAPDESVSRDNPIVVDAFAPMSYTNKVVSPIHFLCGDPAIEWPARVEENALIAAMLKTVKNHGVVEFRSFPGCNHGTCVKPALEYIWKSIQGQQNE